MGIILSAPPTPDGWLDAVTEFGAGLGGLAVIAAAVLAFLYGRRASAAISAKVHRTATGFVVSTRPRVRAVGIFRVTFGQRDDDVHVALTEVYVDGNGDLQERNPREAQGFFGQQFVDPGEELATSVTFSPTELDGSVVGWQAYLRVHAPTRFGRFRRTDWWADQIFVPRPNS